MTGDYRPYKLLDTFSGQDPILPALPYFLAEEAMFRPSPSVALGASFSSVSLRAEQLFIDFF